MTALSRFAKNEALFPVDPFDPQKGETQLLLFSTVSTTGDKGVSEASRDFVEQVQQAVTGWIRAAAASVLMTGRTMSSASWKRDEAPSPDQSGHSFSELKQKMMKIRKRCAVDQRMFRGGGTARRSNGITTLCQQLRHQESDEIPAQPLLNYLMAIAFEQGIKKYAETNMNSVYEHLVRGVFKRPWAEKQHPALRPFAEERDFFLILQEIAVAIGRKRSRGDKNRIMSRCQSGTLERPFGNLGMASADWLRASDGFLFSQVGRRGARQSCFRVLAQELWRIFGSRRIVHR